MINEQIISLVVFAIIASITPGPNNFMLMASGTIFGIKRTIPHILGVVIGFVSLLTSAVLGLAQAILLFPWILLSIKLVGATWLIWLAIQFIKAATQRAADNDNHYQASTRPFKFIEAFAFQWVNPKGLVNAVSCAGAFITIAQSPLHKALIISSVFLVVGFSTCLLWTAAGSYLRKHLCRGRFAIALNILMALLILLTAIIILTV